jgi:5'-3' exonuclease
MSNYKHLCVDGKNAIYRAIFAGYYDQNFMKAGHDFFVILLRFMCNYIELLKPESVHIFWDAPRGQTWRKLLIPSYKDHRADKYKELNFDIHKELARQVTLAINVFKNLNCRQYYADHMEADDLIYAFCKLNSHQKIIIASSDQDFRQIAYNIENVFLYNPLAKTQQVEPKPKYDVVITKSLMGDKSDNINGYYNVGPKRSLALSSDPMERNKFFQSAKAVEMIDGKLQYVGDTLFKKNRRIIDLSLCPHLADNCEYIEHKQLSNVVNDTKKIENMARNHKIRGLLADLARYSRVFESMV